MKKLKIIYLFILVLLVSCDNSTKQQSGNVHTNSATKTKPDNIISVDTVKTQVEKSKNNLQKIEKKVDIMSSIDSFLIKPFDLYKFKEKVGQSNSGGVERKPYYFRPNYNGMYYSFYFFNFKGYVGTNKNAFLKMEMGLNITTFKPLGKYKDEYLDPTEELIEVEAKLNYIDLPELAFVGLDTIEIKKQLGEKSFFKENCFVYTYKDRALILGLNGKTIKWLKYVHLRAPLTNNNTFDKLYSE